jgi:hypothetical protein
MVRRRRAKIVTFEQYRSGASIAPWTREMKASNRLQLSSRARAARLALLFGMVVVWSVVVLGLAAWRARDLVGAAHVADATAFDSRVTGRRLVARVLDNAATTE